jgi:glyoxylase-like metal-dependent hydrolase (beta-lactamase superfamily II)
MAQPAWFEVVERGNGITAIGERLREGADVKSFLVEGERDVAVIDTGTGVGDFAGLVASLSSRAPIVLQTHAHWDHIGSAHRFERVLVHPAEADWLRAGETNASFRKHFGPGAIQHAWLPVGFDPDTSSIPGRAPTGELLPGDRIDLGGRVLEAHHTPGHSPGSMSLLDRQAGVLFVGDAIKIGIILLCLNGSDPVAYRDTLRRMTELAEQVDVIYPSHGATMTAADVRELREAYESIWAGREPTAHQTVNYGEPVEVEVYEVGRFTFLMRQRATSAW